MAGKIAVVDRQKLWATPLGGQDGTGWDRMGQDGMDDVNLDEKKPLGNSSGGFQ